MKNTFHLFPLLLLCLSMEHPVFGETGGIAISPEHPQYWSFRGSPTLLLGGSMEDNLFQVDDLGGQLDLLVSVGGNYVRNTMSSRDSGNVWAFAQEAEGGLYDLDAFNPEYWKRFQSLLEGCAERDIVIQLEIWATFDFYRGNWDLNPFNPKNNNNYTPDRTKLPTHIPTHPVYCDNPFFWSIPSRQNNMPVLQYQQAFVDKLLSYSLAFDNVLYCIDNETSVTSEWGRFWSDYIRKKAGERGKTIHVTEMWDPWDLDHISHRESFDHPEIYSYVEISQNNHQQGQRHWDNGLKQVSRLERAGMLRPLNNVKTYGNDGGKHGGGTQNGIESFVRSCLFGSAAVRFHRPPSGLGLGEEAQAVIAGIREASGRMDFFHARPANDLLRQREDNEAYCRALPGKDYLLYFPDSGKVGLEVPEITSDLMVSRLDLLTGTWEKLKTEVHNGVMELDSQGLHQIYLIQMP